MLKLTERPQWKHSWCLAWRKQSVKTDIKLKNVKLTERLTVATLVMSSLKWTICQNWHKTKKCSTNRKTNSGNTRNV